jgi:hypothetical protein
VIGTSNETALLIAVVGNKLVFRDSEVLADSPKKLIVSDFKNGASDTLHFAESITDFLLKKPGDSVIRHCI